MKKLAACFLILAVLMTGCTGSFKMTKAVYQFHRSQKDKFADELIFLVFVIVPVYGIATIADAVVLNTIEFWTGKNPMTGTGTADNQIALNDGNLTVIRFDAKDNSVEVTKGATKGETLILSRTDAGVVAKDSTGRVLFRSVQDRSGGVTVYDADSKVVSYFDPYTVERGRTAILPN